MGAPRPGAFSSSQMTFGRCESPTSTGSGIRTEQLCCAAQSQPLFVGARTARAPTIRIAQALRLGSESALSSRDEEPAHACQARKGWRRY